MKKQSKFKLRTLTDIKVFLLFLLDNIRYWQVELTPDEGGMPPVEKDEEPLGHNTSTLDKDAWT